MPLLLHDTFTRQLKEIRPSDERSLRFYCCGPTVYAPAHIGNLRTFVLQDVFRRTVEATGIPVRHVRNLTDVDDKTIRAANEHNLPLEDFTRPWITRFQADCQSLNMLPPSEEPAATAHIPEQIKLIETLLAKGHAYATDDGSVYFKVTSFPTYGKLSRLDERELQSIAPEGPQDADEYEKADRSDFALWKGRKAEDGEVYWNAPWGQGRPGWHLECSAMSMAALGQTLDVHGGGVDLVFPHHENEIAQSEACTGQIFVHHWFHCAHLMVEGEKMSKSLGNMYTLEDLTKDGLSPLVVRFVLLSGHYRQQLNFTFNALHAANEAMRKFSQTLLRILPRAEIDLETFRQWCSTPGDENKLFAESTLLNAWNLLCRDLNTSGAWGQLMKQRGQWEKEKDPKILQRDLRALAHLLYALGLDQLPFTPKKEKTNPEAPAEIRALAEDRWKAKADRDFTTADQLRESLKQKGWLVKDSRDGYTLSPGQKS
ncbi:MAG: cysteine--tRNA ligase [Opitutales bacterium]|nr:cysteine--tRNA ligase [Opitutales bacterium]MCH8539542.1 cysteine--tRNA ligase [Opitutales bacterium]